MKTAEYELVLMLDAAAPEEAREQLAGDARARIEGSGELRHAESWGIRKMAYEIEQRTEADYRFFRFESEAPNLDDLRHSLRIADGILRFRIFEVDPKAPLLTPPEITFGAPRERDSRGRGRRRDHDDDYGVDEEGGSEAESPVAEPAAELAESPAAEPAAEAPSEVDPPGQNGSPAEGETPAEDAPEPSTEDQPASAPEPPAEEPAK